MKPKNTKKPAPKKPLPKIPGLPKNADVKVIEINPLRIAGYILFAVLLGWTLFTTWTQYTATEEITYVDDK